MDRPPDPRPSVLWHGAQESACIIVSNVGQGHSYQLIKDTLLGGTKYHWIQSPQWPLCSVLGHSLPVHTEAQVWHRFRVDLVLDLVMTPTDNTESGRCYCCFQSYVEP